MRPYIAVALFAVWLSAADRLNAEDWSLSTFHAGPRSASAYEPSSVSYARPRWRETQRRYYRPRRHHYDHIAAPELRDDYRHEVRLYRPDEGPRDRKRFKCLERVTVVGSQWAGESGAEESAQKAFMEQVRWNDGESFMDIKNAEGYAKRCARSSIGEVAGATLHRCEVSALPCREIMARTEPK
jgi:hypothetical protein